MAVNVGIGAGIFSNWRRPWLPLLFCLSMLFAGCDDIRRDKKESSKPADIRDKCLRLAIEIDDQSWPWHRSNEYETDCEKRELRGCLLPPEENSKVEEYKYRQRNCPSAEKDCGILSTRIGYLQKEKLSLRQHKNDLCRGLNLNGDHGNNCRYAIRRVAAVIDAITAAETSFEEQCFE